MPSTFLAHSDRALGPRRPAGALRLQVRCAAPEGIEGSLDRGSLVVQAECGIRLRRLLVQGPSLQLLRLGRTFPVGRGTTRNSGSVSTPRWGGPYGPGRGCGSRSRLTGGLRARGKGLGRWSGTTWGLWAQGVGPRRCPRLGLGDLDFVLGILSLASGPKVGPGHLELNRDPGLPQVVGSGLGVLGSRRVS